MNVKAKRYLASNLIKISAMSFGGLAVSIFLYPFLHEAGHALVAHIIGAEVVQIEILPIPFVMCNVAALTNEQEIIIGVSGMLFPLVAAVLIPHRWFWCWYIRFLLFGISLLAYVISAITLILPDGAELNPNDDMLRVLSLWSGSKATLIGGLVACVILVVALTLFDRPTKMIYRKFNL